MDTPDAPILVHHPSPVSFVPPRGRVLRHGYEWIETAVAPQRASEAEVEPVRRAGPEDLPEDFFQEEAFAYRGGVFVEVADREGRPLSPADFLGLISRPRAGTLLTGVFRGTPLEPMPPLKTSLYEGEAQPPVDLAATPPRRLAFRDRDHAAAALRRFLAEDVAMTETRVLRRVPPLVVPRLGTGESDAILEAGPAFSLKALPPVRPDRVRDVEAAFAKAHLARIADSDVALVAERFPRELLGDDDLLAIARGLPAAAVALADSALPLSTMNGIGAREAVTAARDELVPWALRGRIGAIGRDEAAHALAASAALLRAIEANVRCRMSYLGEGFERSEELVAYVEDRLLPRLGYLKGEAAEAADAEAFDGLAP